MEWEQSKAVVPASSNFRWRSAVRGQAPGVRVPAVCHQDGSRQPAARTQSSPRLSDSHKWPSSGPPGQRQDAATPEPPPARPLPRPLSLHHHAGNSPSGTGRPKPGLEATRGAQPLPGAPPPSTQPQCAPGAPRAKPAPGRATHLHSSGNSAPWARAAPGAQTSSSSCSRSRERGGRPAGAGPRWALRPAAAPIAPGPGCAAGTGLAARGCQGPRPGHACAARAEVDRGARGAGAEREPEGRAARLGSAAAAAAAPEPRHVSAAWPRPRPAPLT